MDFKHWARTWHLGAVNVDNSTGLDKDEALEPWFSQSENFEDSNLM